MTPEDVLAYYEQNVEEGRLARGVGALELERTKELVLRFVEAPARVADVGGAAGLYSDWLASLGCRVELVDPVPLHVEQARARAGEPARFGVHRGDARALPFPDGSVDAVLLLGPLYHLGERAERLRAIREAARVCRPGGVVLAAAICRFAPLLDLVLKQYVVEERAFANVIDEVRDGRRVPPERRNGSFPDAWFHLPEELAAELADGGFEALGVYGIEGPGAFTPELERLWQDDEVRRRLLALAREVETDPHLVSLSFHLLGVGRRR